MKTPWQRRTVTLPGLAPFPALVDPFEDNFGNYLFVTEKNGPDDLMKAHADQIGPECLKDYDTFARLEELYYCPLNREEILLLIEQLVAQTRKSSPATASILLSLSACLHEGTEMQLAKYLVEFRKDRLAHLAAPRN